MESISFPLSIAGVSGIGLMILGYIVRKGMHSQCTIPGIGSVDIDIHTTDQTSSSSSVTPSHSHDPEHTNDIELQSRRQSS